MLGKFLGTVTLILPLIRGFEKIWKNKESGTAEKIAESITIIIPLIVGMADTWKKTK